MSKAVLVFQQNIKKTSKLVLNGAFHHIPYLAFSFYWLNER